MMRLIPIFAVSIAALANASFAADRSDIKLLEQTKISLADAIKAAEKKTSGRAIEAGLDDDAWKPSYEVSVAVNGAIHEVQVDGISGDVLGVREDLDD
jgi:uncharacterized membrane protein YkoI